MATLDNANPTILSASQLPTRGKRTVARHGPESKYSHVILEKPSYLTSPFCFDSEDSDSDNSWGGAGGIDDQADPIDEQEIYGGCSPPLHHILREIYGKHLTAVIDLISTISDPEHPVSLGQLSVINLPDIHVTPAPLPGVVPSPDTIVTVLVDITPTITHCSLATVIGLGVRVRLEQALPPNYRVVVRCKKDSHSQDEQVNKQLADKERVAAALENDTLKGVLDKMLETCL